MGVYGSEDPGVGSYLDTWKIPVTVLGREASCRGIEIPRLSGVLTVITLSYFPTEFLWESSWEEVELDSMPPMSGTVEAQEGHCICGPPNKGPLN